MGICIKRWIVRTCALMWFGLCINVFTTQAAKSSSRKEILMDLLDSSKYDASIAPDFERDHPTNVSIQIFIVNIYSVNEAHMEYSMDLFFRQFWFDSRLGYYNRSNLPWLELDSKLIGKAWVPDTYFANEKRASVHTVTVPNKLMHVYQNGTILYSMRLSLTLSCPMRLEKYPMDDQICPVIIESYAYTVENIVYSWHTHRPFSFIYDVEMPQFEPSALAKFSDCDKDYESRGKFACIQAQIHLTRKMGYYVVQIFIPSVLIVMLSWVSFWVDIDAVPARISLGVLTVLTMTTQSSGARQSLPMVSYVKAIDVWMAVCLLFVFSSLLEFAWVNVLSRRKVSAKKKDPPMEENNFGNINTSTRPSPALTQFLDNKKRARRVDAVCRLVYPIAFAVFNLAYWIYYIRIPNPR